MEPVALKWTLVKQIVIVRTKLSSLTISHNSSFSFQRLLGINIWNADRGRRPWVNFPAFKNHKTRQHYYHPVKWSPMLEPNNQVEVQNYIKFLCNSVLPYLHPPRIEPVLPNENPLVNNAKQHPTPSAQIYFNLLYLKSKAKNKTK